MKNSLIQLNNDIDGLIEYIDYNEAVKKFIILAKKDNGKIQKNANAINYNTNNAKTFEYNSYIISLYGFFERFIEDIARSYLGKFSSLYSNYSELPEIVKNSNIEKVTDLLNKLELPKYQEMDANKIVKILNDNINNGIPSVCIEAFTYHSANFRPKTIGEFFKPIGLNSVLQDVSLIPPMSIRLSELFDNPPAHTEESRFEVINTLAERRNHIAHGVQSVDIMSPNDIKNWCLYIKDFCDSLYQSLRSQQLGKLIENIESSAKSLLVKIEPIKIFGNKILCFESRNEEIKVGQQIIIKRSSKPNFIIKEIKSIKINSHDIIRCPPYINKSIGVNLLEGIKSTQSFYLAKEKI